MNGRRWALFAVVLLLGAGARWAVPALSDDAAKAEREKALANPYPNDFGPAKLDDVSSYTPERREGYRLMLDKCARCHTPARPLNSQFLDLKPDELAALKARQPEIFRDKKVWQPETGVWQRYIKRMMAKPGCDIPDAQGRKIFRFLVEYSRREKTGPNAAKWAAHRRKLLAEFKQKYPARYKELFQE